jgi:hypothetical protein
VVLGVAAVVALAVVVVVALQMSLAPTLDAPMLAASVPAPQVAAVASAPAASEPAVLHPLDVASGAAAAAPTTDVREVLGGVFTPKVVLSMFQLDDFARRVVATVDNLGRTHAPSRLWPLNPVPGRFSVDAQGGVDAIADDNAQRYAPYVALLDDVPVAQVVAAYKALYPQLQRAYQDLGFPRRYFNDRVVEVIDQLLDTPEPVGPLQVHLPQLNGPIAPPRPWILYEFDDPRWQALSAGQRIMLRVGVAHERRLKAQLLQIRALVAFGKPAASAPAATSATSRP